jgi:hypothetical protein
LEVLGLPGGPRQGWQPAEAYGPLDFLPSRQRRAQAMYFSKVANPLPSPFPPAGT